MIAPTRVEGREVQEARQEARRAGGRAAAAEVTRAGEAIPEAEVIPKDAAAITGAERSSMTQFSLLRTNC
jgi:hypothetical protein